MQGLRGCSGLGSFTRGLHSPLACNVSCPVTRLEDFGPTGIRSSSSEFLWGGVTPRHPGDWSLRSQNTAECTGAARPQDAVATGEQTHLQTPLCTFPLHHVQSWIGFRGQNILQTCPGGKKGTHLSSQSTHPASLRLEHGCGTLQEAETVSFREGILGRRSCVSHSSRTN